MADGSAPVIPAVRIGVPLLKDFAYLAEQMRPDEVAQFLAQTGAEHYNPDTVARACANAAGPSFVLIDRDNRPIAVGGFEPLRPGVYETWGVGTVDGWRQHWQAMTLVSNRIMRDLFARDAHRIQICSLTSRTAAHHWYERGLGMTREAVLSGWYADGQDAVMFARTRKPQ